ncbi:hypothetical protein FZD47_25525 [Bacillus infantis]|uniref:Uncharacterized protein n=1 Tax=Bacillus infantis TaxID=324767 RepID=A0A5D4S102_9BACI|nr:hypothetical protein [Bacillus infantis]TYS55788.1 hypothetical protein FZD47_25525 [Bacillus infantis]
MYNPKKKHFKIEGFKFHQDALDHLKKEIEHPEELGWDKPLSAAAVAMYIGLVSECSTTGLIDADVSISSIAKKLNLLNSTAHNGYHQLLNRLLIRPRLVGNKTQIEISGYAKANRSREESNSKGSGLSYFIVPNEVFNTPIIPQLVNATSARGLLLFLEECNHFTRDFKNKRKDINSNPDDLKMSTLKKKLALPSAARVRKVLDILTPIFTFTPDKVKIREPRKNSTGLRKLVEQIHIKKYIIRINPACVIEKAEVDTESMKAIKNAQYRLKDLRVPLTRGARIGIEKAYRAMVKEVAFFLDDIKEKRSLLRFSMQTALDNLEKYLKDQPKKLNVGGYINSQLQQFIFNFLDNMDSRIDLKGKVNMAYADGSEPFIWKAYDKHRTENRLNN